MKITQHLRYMNTAHLFSFLSPCKKRQVGCAIVTTSGRMIVGYNVTAPGECTCCEDEEGNTLPSIIHAEINAIQKATSEELIGASIYVTYGPCIPCMQTIIQCGITEVFFGEYPTKNIEIDFMNKSGIKCVHIPINNNMELPNYS